MVHLDCSAFVRGFSFSHAAGRFRASRTASISDTVGVVTMRLDPVAACRGPGQPCSDKVPPAREQACSPSPDPPDPGKGVWATVPVPKVSRPPGDRDHIPAM